MSEQTSLVAPAMERTANLSPDGVYRYRLGRRWAPGGSRMAFVMLNPSTADADVDDPTIRRCIGFAKREGCSAIAVVNLYAFRATKPVRVAEADARGVDIVGPENLLHLQTAVGSSDLVVAAWGGSIEKLPRRDWLVDYVVDLCVGLDRDLFALGHTAAGHPRHPLYVKGDAPLVDAGLA